MTSALHQALPPGLPAESVQDLHEQWTQAALHEAAHCVAARALGYRTSLMTLTPYYTRRLFTTVTSVHGYTQVEEIEHHPNHGLVVAVAGAAAIAAADQGSLSLAHVLDELALNPGDTAAADHYGAAADIDLHEAVRLAHDLIAHDWDLLHNVADLLAEHGQLT